MCTEPAARFGPAITDRDQIIRKTRSQVRDLLGGLRASIDGDASHEDLLSMIEVQLSRLPTD